MLSFQCQCCCESLWLTLVVIVIAMYIQLCYYFGDFGVVFQAYLFSCNSCANVYIVLCVAEHMLEVHKT